MSSTKWFTRFDSNVFASTKTHLKALYPSKMVKTTGYKTMDVQMCMRLRTSVKRRNELIKNWIHVIRLATQLEDCQPGGGLKMMAS